MENMSRIDVINRWMKKTTYTQVYIYKKREGLMKLKW